MSLMSRRAAMAATAAGVGGLVTGFSQPISAQAAPDKLTVIGHAVLRTALTTGNGGDIATEWTKSHGPRLEWLTFSVPEIHERLFREASLAHGSIDLAFVLNRYLGPRIATLLTPLDDLMASQPIEAFSELPAGMLQSLRFSDKLYGIPFRHATSGLHYNTALFEERGLSSPPTSVAELLEFAEKLTYKRSDGTRVSGLIWDGPGPSQIIDLARCWNADFVDTSYKVRADEPAMIKAVTVAKQLYDKGILPKSFPQFSTDSTITFMQQGRAAMALSPFSRFAQFNDARASKFPGKIQVTNIPADDSIKSQFPIAPAKTEFWSFAIPRNTDNAAIAWSLIQTASTVANTIRAARNGNGPVRASTYKDSTIVSELPYAKFEQAALALARPPLPGWEKSGQAEEIFAGAIQSILISAADPAKTLADASSQVRALLPS
jgi:multiple sugar transport system substrate-binding protein